jgi:hypothetical protein
MSIASQRYKKFHNLEYQIGPVERVLFDPIGEHLSDTVGAVVVNLDPVPSQEVNQVLFQSNDAAVRLTLNGTTPVADSVGFLIPTGILPVLIDIAPSVQIQVVSDDGSDADVQYQYGIGAG